MVFMVQPVGSRCWGLAVGLLCVGHASLHTPCSSRKPPCAPGCLDALPNLRSCCLAPSRHGMRLR